MSRSPEIIKQEILQFLAGERFDQTIKSIASAVKLSKITTSKYLMALVVEKKIKSRQEGNTLLYSLSEDNTGGV